MLWQLIRGVLLGTVVLAASSTATAADSCEAGSDEGVPGVVVRCPDYRDPGQGGSTGPENSDYEPPESWAYEPAWGSQPDSGEPCIDLQYRANVEPQSEIAIEWEMQTLQMIADLRLDGVVDFWCDPAIAEAMQSPDLLANGFVRRLPLPEPALGIDPGFALTGMPAYLVIGNQDGFTVNEYLDGWGAMEVTFTPSSFEVDWGDGTVDHVVGGRTGARWNGPSAQQISHTYSDSDRARAVDGNTVVTVTSTWDADWSVAGFSGTVIGLIIDGTFDLPVREYRAVRVDPAG